MRSLLSCCAESSNIVFFCVVPLAGALHATDCGSVGWRREHCQVVASTRCLHGSTDRGAQTLIIREGTPRVACCTRALSCSASALVRPFVMLQISMSGLDPAQLERQKGSTAVHVAVEMGHVGILELLLARGNASPDVADKVQACG